MGKRKSTLVPCSSHSSSSSSSSKKKKKRSMLFGGYCQYRRQNMWFHFDLVDDNDDDKLLINPVYADDSNRLRKLFSLNPEFEQLFYRYNTSHLPSSLAPFFIAPPRKNLLFSVCIQLDSFVYAFGGNPIRPTRKVWVFSITNDDGTPREAAGGACLWKRAPSMRSRRAQSTLRAVSLRGKLYVMGGNNLSRRKETHFAEVYDPYKQTWTYLPPPPSDIGYSHRLSLCVADETSNKIHVSQLPVQERRPPCRTMFVTPGYHPPPLEYMYIYNADTGAWEYTNNFAPPIENPSLVGQTIYWLRGSELCAFDINRKCTFDPCQIIELEEEYAKNDQWILPRPVLLPLDDEHLCILWVIACGGLLTQRKMSCHFLKIRVSHSALETQKTGNLLLYAITKSCRHYIIDYHVRLLSTCLLSSLD